MCAAAASWPANGLASATSRRKGSRLPPIASTERQPMASAMLLSFSRSTTASAPVPIDIPLALISARPSLGRSGHGGMPASLSASRPGIWSPRQIAWPRPLPTVALARGLADAPRVDGEELVLIVDKVVGVDLAIAQVADLRVEPVDLAAAQEGAFDRRPRASDPI